MPWEWWVWKMARETGWTLDYIESLSVGHWHEYFQIDDAIGKARPVLRKRAEM